MRPPHSAIRLLLSPYLVRSRLSGRNAVSVMADDLRRLAASADQILADDMQLLGWTQQQLNSHGADARRIALQRSTRENAPPKGPARPTKDAAPVRRRSAA